MQKDNLVQLQFTTINHVARKALELTMMEYCVADSIYHLSNNPKYSPWCRASKQYLADFLGISRRYVIEIIHGVHNDKENKPGLIDRGILEEPEAKFKQDPRLRTTQLWYNTAIIKKGSEQSAPGSEQSAPLKAESSEQSSHYNDNVGIDSDKDNVSEKIQSLFRFFKIPAKDQAVWRALNIDDPEYLLRQLVYAYDKRETIKQPVKFIQSALDKDYMFTDQATAEKRDQDHQKRKNDFTPAVPGFVNGIIESIDIVSRDNTERNRQRAAMANR